MNAEQRSTKAKLSTRYAAATEGKRSAKSKKPQGERVAVVVLSMHRTGSSALSRVLSLLGCDLPKTLLGENGSNQAGHWESTEVRDLNDELLASGGSDWQDWQAFNPHWYETVRPLEFRPRAQQVLHEEFGASRLFVFKDPRVCRIFPFWREAFAEAGIEPKVILTLRHPHEVAASLEQRDRMNRQQGLLLWLRHVLEAEAASRGVTRAVVQYDSMLATPMSVVTDLQDRLRLYWPRLSDQTADEIRGFMQPSLRHHKVAVREGGIEALGFGTWLEQVYDIFLRWCHAGEDPADYEVLDLVRTRLNDLSEPLREVVEILSAQLRELAQKAEAMNGLTSERQTLGSDLNAAQRELSTLKEQQTTLQAELEAKDAETRALQTELERARDGREERETEARTLRAELEQARAGLGTAEKETVRLATELGQRDEEIADLKAEMHKLRSSLEQRSHEAEETAKELEAAQNQIRLQQQETERLRGGLAGAEAALAAAREAGQADAAEIAGLRTAVEAAGQARKEGERALAHLRGRVSELDAKMGVQSGELAQLAKLVLEKEEALKRRNAAAHKASKEAEALRQETTALQEDLQRIRDEVEGRSRALAEAEQALTAVEAHRQALLDSTSWRITSPLRGLILMLRRGG